MNQITRWACLASIGLLSIGLAGPEAQAAAKIWIAGTPMEFDSPSAWSPFGAPFFNDTPLFITTGQRTVLFDTNPTTFQMVASNGGSVTFQTGSGSGSTEFVYTLTAGGVIRDSFSDLKVVGNGNRRMRLESVADFFMQGGTQIELTADRGGTINLLNSTLHMGTASSPASGNLLASNGGKINVRNLSSLIGSNVIVDGAGSEINISGAFQLGNNGITGNPFRVLVRNGGKFSTGSLNHISASGSRQPLELNIATGGRWNHAGNVAFVGFSVTLSTFNGTVDIAGTLDIGTANTVTIQGGTLKTQRLVGSKGSFNWQAGELHITGIQGVTIQLGGNHEDFNGVLLLQNRTLRVNHTLTVTQGSTLSIGNGQVFAGDIFNAGTLNATIGTSISAPTTNQGIVTGPVGNNGFFRFADRVDGDGDYAGNVEFLNIFSPGNSTARVEAENLRLVTSSTLMIEVGGTTPGSGPNGHDQVDVTANASLGGGLDITLLNSFAPDYFNEFKILTADTRNGKFDSVTGALVNPDMILAPVYDHNGIGVTLVAALPGDANLDGTVNGDDLLRWQANLFSGDEFVQGDFNLDGSVNGDDLLIWQSHLFDTVPLPAPATAPIPEPGTAVLLGLAGFGLMRQRIASIVSGSV